MEKLPSITNYIYVISRNNEYLGSVKLLDLFTDNRDTPIEEIMDESVEPINADVKADQVVIEFQNLDLISAPVVDASNRLLG